MIQFPPSLSQVLFFIFFCNCSLNCLKLTGQISILMMCDLLYDLNVLESYYS